TVAVRTGRGSGAEVSVCGEQPERAANNVNAAATVSNSRALAFAWSMHTGMVQHFPFDGQIRRQNSRLDKWIFEVSRSICCKGD
ncbi:MAG: hypothetical protein WBF50_18435, partial [Pseudolabrys sp.]